MRPEEKTVFSIYQASITSTIYVTIALLVNFTISWWPPREVLGINMPPGLLLVGAIFVMRDYTQREVGHWVIALTILAAMLTYYSVDPAVALASGTAFVVSEIIDWLVYYQTQKTLKDRILISLAIAVPFDGWIFLSMMGWLTTELFLVNFTLKMIASVLMWIWLANKINTSTLQAPAG